MLKIGYLGPEGTFSHQAARKYIRGREGAELVAFITIPDCLEAASKGQINFAVVPIENSIEGTVNFTIDSLIFDVDVTIIEDLVLPIKHNLVARKGVTAESITKIFSHPQALAQCRKKLDANHHGIERVQVTSTAESARTVLNSHECWAGICTKEAAEIFDLQILQEDLQDEMLNETRFLVVTGQKNIKTTLEGKTSIVFGTDDKPGELYKILDIIAIWDLNMTKIESRPMKNELGRYVFYIDMESNNAADIRDALKMIERKASFFKHLGTYTTAGAYNDLI